MFYKQCCSLLIDYAIDKLVVIGVHCFVVIRVFLQFATLKAVSKIITVEEGGGAVCPANGDGLKHDPGPRHGISVKLYTTLTCA